MTQSVRLGRSSWTLDVSSTTDFNLIESHLALLIAKSFAKMNMLKNYSNSFRPRVQREDVRWDGYKRHEIQASQEGITDITVHIGTKCNFFRTMVKHNAVVCYTGLHKVQIIET